MVGARHGSVALTSVKRAAGVVFVFPVETYGATGEVIDSLVCGGEAVHAFALGRFGLNIVFHGRGAELHLLQVRLAALQVLPRRGVLDVEAVGVAGGLELPVAVVGQRCHGHHVVGIAVVLQVCVAVVGVAVEDGVALSGAEGGVGGKSYAHGPSPVGLLELGDLLGVGG